MLKLLVAAVFVAAVMADLDSEWFAFKIKYKKKYDCPREEMTRKFIWQENAKRIEEHNKQYRLGLTSYFLGENEFSDMTDSEFSHTMKGLKVPSGLINEPETGQAAVYDTRDFPATVDWRKEGLVTHVKNQGDCGSCWAFSTTGVIEGQHAKATGNLVSLSESQLVDCTIPFGNSACFGGWMYNAYRYIIANNGIDTELSYPYTEVNKTCAAKFARIGATISGYGNVTKGSESALQEAVATIGPISVTIDAEDGGFQNYKGGVFDYPKCNKNFPNHAVLVAGYGTYEGKDYWLVKNSWGESWGIKGYVMMSRNKDNQCGIANYASYPLV